MISVMMSHLVESNSGRHKNELVLGLCQRVSPRLIPNRALHQKHCVAAFKYLFNYLVNRRYVSDVQMACPACNKVPNMAHACLAKFNDKDLKLARHYALLNTVDKRCLHGLFHLVCQLYGDGEEVTLCTCILFFKCLTIWRHTMRRQFVEHSVPRGISCRLMQSIKQVIESWENGTVELSSLHQC